MLRTGADSDDPVIAFDGRQSPIAAELQRGACRYLRALGHSVVTELALGVNSSQKKPQQSRLLPGGSSLRYP